MMESDIFIRILLAVLFGAILGLETETREIKRKGKETAKKEEKNRIGGLRTYTILSLIGGIAGLLFKTGETTLAYIMFAGILALIVAAYVQNVQLKQAFGLTTEIAIIITFLLGFFTTSDLIPITAILFILVILAFFLSQKRGVGAFIEKIQHDEVIDILKFGIVSVVILPILPNKTYYISDLLTFINAHQVSLSEDIKQISIINPFSVWTIVVVISGINLFGYLLSKLVGAKQGLLATAIVGGLISSTSTTIALAIKSKNTKTLQSYLLAGSAVVANAMSFISIIILISITNANFLSNVILPVATMFFIGLITGVCIIYMQNLKLKSTERILIKHENFSIGPALKFVGIIVILTLIIQILQLTEQSYASVFVTAVSGIIGLDAPTVTLLGLEGSGVIAMNLAILTFLITNAINFVSKSFIGYAQGSKPFFKALAFGLALTIMGSLTILLV